MTYMSNGFLPLLWYVSSHFGHWLLLRPWLFDVRRAHFAWWVRVHRWKFLVATGLHLGCQVFLLMVWNILKGREVADAIGRDSRERWTLAEFETGLEDTHWLILISFVTLVSIWLLFSLAIINLFLFWGECHIYLHLYYCWKEFSLWVVQLNSWFQFWPLFTLFDFYFFECFM